MPPFLFFFVVEGVGVGGIMSGAWKNVGMTMMCNGCDVINII